MLRVVTVLFAVVVMFVTMAPAGGPDGQATELSQDRIYGLANQCRVLFAHAADAFVVAREDGYRAEGQLPADGEPFFMEPTGLGAFVFHDRERQYLAVDDPVGEASGVPAPVGVTRTGDVGESAEWRLEGVPDGVTITSTASGHRLVADPDGELGLAEKGDAGDRGRFRFVGASGCTPFPEAEIGAVGEPFAGTRSDGTVWGIADAHTQVSAFQRLGGKVIHGLPFHRFGITHALAEGSDDHGPEGTADFLGNFLRNGAPAGSHDTAGWPTFPEWPAYDTYTHQQSYYVWLQRMWMAGLRLMVTNAVADEQLCQIMPRREHGCDEMDTVRLQLASLRELEGYVDAQAGGPGDGFFRIVGDPAEARRIIEDGKLAVVLGIESSKLFGCGEFLDEPECTADDIDAGIEEFHDLGVRTVFPTHWFDNAYAGVGLFGQSELELNALNKAETGHYYRVEDCPSEGMGADLQSVGQHQQGDDPLSQLVNDVQSQAVPTYPPGPHCNAKDLTDLGEHLIRRLIDRGMLIETDHVGAKAKNSILDIAEECVHPVVSSHFHAGGTTSTEQFERILAVGGLAAPINPSAEQLPATVRMLEDLAGDHPYFAVPMSSDTGGLAALPGPLEDTQINYPFTSADGQVTFIRQRTGEREFDLNIDGVAHHGLYADWLEAISLQPGGDHAIDVLFRSAEAYLRMWERATSPGPCSSTNGGTDPTPPPADTSDPLPATGAPVPAALGLLAIAIAVTATRRHRHSRKRS